MSIEIEPSTELLNTALEGSRHWAQYIEKLVKNRYPDNESEPVNTPTERSVVRAVTRKLEAYENGWLSKHLPTVIDEHRTLSLAEASARPSVNELTPHIIFRAGGTASLNHLLGWGKPAGQTRAKVEAAQIAIQAAQALLAVESVAVIQYQNEIGGENSRYLDKQLLDIDAMIRQLGTIAFNAKAGIPSEIAIPNPQRHVSETAHTEEVEFLLFSPNNASSYTVSELKTDDILGNNTEPGEVAKQILAETAIHKVALAPLFQKKGTVGALIDARRAIL